MKLSTWAKNYAKKNNPDWSFERYRTEQMWVRMKIDGLEDLLKDFLKTTYANY